MAKLRETGRLEKKPNGKWHREYEHNGKNYWFEDREMNSRPPSREEIEREHGAPIRSKKMISYYRTGASRDSTGFFWGPPSDEWEKAKLVHHYWSLACHRATSEYRSLLTRIQHFSAQMQTQRMAGPPKWDQERLAAELTPRLNEIRMLEGKVKESAEAVEAARPESLKLAEKTWADNREAHQRLLVNLDKHRL